MKSAAKAVQDAKLEIRGDQEDILETSVDIEGVRVTAFFDTSGGEEPRFLLNGLAFSEREAAIVALVLLQLSPDALGLGGIGCGLDPLGRVVLRMLSSDNGLIYGVPLNQEEAAALSDQLSELVMLANESEGTIQ